MDFEEFMTPPVLTDSKRVLVIQPHPDDNEIGMGATVAKLTANGTEVIYLTVTNGDRGIGDPEVSLLEAAEIRRKETEASGKILGVRRFFSLGLPDGGPLDRYQTAVMIAGVIRQVKPDTLLCPDPWMPYEGHPDHRDTGFAAVQAFMNSGLRDFPRGGEYERFAPANIGFYFTAAPNSVVDVTDTFEKKFEAIAAHRSQVSEEMMQLYRVYFTMKAQELAQGKGFALGEGFKMLRRIHLHCCVDSVRI